MHNKVVYQIARSLYESGFAALRFNFRGVGRSAGSHDNGRGEQEDLRAAIQFIMRRHRDAQLWLAGFSFGAVIALKVGCSDPRARALIAVGLPVSASDLSGAADCHKPKLIVQGSHDQFGIIEDIARFFAGLSEPKELVIVPGADHFFEGHLGELAKAVSQFAAQ
jgi:hypothetical protein